MCCSVTDGDLRRTERGDDVMATAVSKQNYVILLTFLQQQHSAYSESVSWIARPIGEASSAEPKFVCE